MSGGIFLLRGEDDLIPMTAQPYDTEEVLQALLARFPDLLAGDQFGSGTRRRWLLIAREAGLPSEQEGPDRWSVDHFFVDQDAVPTLVEVKRSSDTRIRREVVGQLLDYAANAVVYWPIESVRSTFERRCEQEGRDPDTELSALIGRDEDGETFWQQVGSNLQSGRIRLVFVSDEIPRELRRVVEFLNEQMKADVIAIEVKQYVAEGLRTLVPRVIGETAAAETRKRTGARGPGREWDEQSFFADLETRCGSEEAQIARAIEQWASQQSLRLVWGKGNVNGTLMPRLDHDGQSHTPIVLYSHGYIEVQFQRLMQRPPFDDLDLRRELLRRFNQVPGLRFAENRIDGFPSFRYSRLGESPDALNAFLSVLDWFCDTVRART